MAEGTPIFHWRNLRNRAMKVIVRGNEIVSLSVHACMDHFKDVLLKKLRKHI